MGVVGVWSIDTSVKSKIVVDFMLNLRLPSPRITSSLAPPSMVSASLPPCRRS